MSEAGTMTRADLADAIHREVGLSRADSARMVESILGRMCGAPADGENVTISGFGTFVLRDKGERIGSNPKTGFEVPIGRSEERRVGKECGMTFVSRCVTHH